MKGAIMIMGINTSKWSMLAILAGSITTFGVTWYCDQLPPPWECSPIVPGCPDDCHQVCFKDVQWGWGTCYSDYDIVDTWCVNLEQATQVDSWYYPGSCPGGSCQLGQRESATMWIPANGASYGGVDCEVGPL
jgi:hypothetical protein